MVDRLHKSRSNNWANTGISNSGKLSGSKSSSSAQEGGRNFGTDQYRENYPVLDSIVFGIRGTAFRSQCIPYLEALHPEALPHNPQHAFTTYLWKLPALRHRDARYPTIRSSQTGRRIGLGVLRSLSKSDFESFHDRKEVGLSFGRQPGGQRRVTRKDVCPREAHSHRQTDPAAFEGITREDPRHGPSGNSDGLKGRR